MGRAEDNKQRKRTSLMDTAFSLFTDQGIAKTSIADIAAKAGVAKGTFYLYFKDKYDLHEKLVIHKSEQLFRHAVEQSGYQTQTTAPDKLLALLDDILEQLRQNKSLLQFLSRNMSWGVFRRTLTRWGTEESSVLTEILDASALDRETRELEAYTILELVGASCHSVILRGEPVGLDEYLPHLHRAILAVIDSFERPEGACAVSPSDIPRG